MGPYDSPTFLGRKDKIAMGMTMGQLIKGIGLMMGLLTFWLILIDHVGMLVAVIGFVVSLVGTVVVLSVKISGVKIPAYLMKLVMMSIRRPAYVAEALGALQVLEPKVDFLLPSASGLDEAPRVGLLRRLFSVGRKRTVAAVQDQDNRYMAKAQVDSVSANAFTEGRRQFRSLLKEFAAFLPKFRR